MLSYKMLDETAKRFGESFYLLDRAQIKRNYEKLINAFQKIYKDTSIAYSYKTNYIPQICKVINELGGAAEVVSEMELWLAQSIGVKSNEIYYNGPYKKPEYIEKAMLSGAHVNLDAEYEIEIVHKIAEKYPEHLFEIGLRCNIDIGQEEPSRFGFDVASGALQKAMEDVGRIRNVEVTGLHCHIPFRTLESYRKRVEKMDMILNMFPDRHFAYISMGGGYMGEIEDQMKSQFNFNPPSFEDYADVVAGFMRDRYQNQTNAPTLIIEPGSALAANAMKYVARVLNIKRVRDLYIASLTGSTFQMNPSVKNMNRPIEVYCVSDNTDRRDSYRNLYMAGYTCIESDYLYKGYDGRLGVGDYVVFGNAGSYSVVMKPPFILPDIPILEIQDDGEITVWKEAQKVEEVFNRFTGEET